MSIFNSVLRRTMSAASFAGEAAGHGAVAAAKGADKAVSTVFQPIGNKIADVGASTLNPSKLVKYDKDGLPSGLSGRGRLMVGGIALAGIGYNGIQERIANDMGSSDGKIYSATPDYSVYNQKKQPSPTAPPAGADGSLVFALDKTKNGGFL